MYNLISRVAHMKHKQRVTKGGKSGRQKRKSSAAGARRKTGRRKVLSLHASAESSRRPHASLEDVLEFYKPIKKPVTLRLDADVLAWFKRDGRRYQTRINAALRRVMEKEIKSIG
jgi:uncharacterized protein (DUF4415 family)